MKTIHIRPSIRAKATAAIFVACIALVLGWPLDSGSALDLGRSYRLAKLRSIESLLPKAQENGQIRVIVELNVPFKPEGDFYAPILALVQRQQIKNVQNAVRSRAVAPNIEILHEFKYLPLMTLRVNAAGLEALAANPHVRSIHEEVPLPALLQDSIPLIGADTAWASGYSGAGQVIAILDTGVDSDHEFLAGKTVAEACFSTTDESEQSITLCPNGLDRQVGAGAGANCALADCEHGTHVAGIAAGNIEGFSGVAKDADILAVQVFSGTDSESFCGAGNNPCLWRTWPTDYVDALEWVYEQRDTYQIATVNMSFGVGGFTSTCDTHYAKSAIDLLRSVGIASVIASGNDEHVDAIASPACISSAVSVGSTTKSDDLSIFSNVASFISLLAPGGEISNGIRSSIPGNSYERGYGTSMAAPHVAGAWALLKSKNPSASVDEILTALTTTGVLIDDTREGGIETEMSRIQVDAALAALAPPTPTPTPTTTPTAGSNLVLDGSFEQGSPNPVWNEFSSNFGTPLCTLELCGDGGGTGPHSGDWWSWFGGIPEVVEEGSVDQDITIPAGSSNLSFWLEIPAAVGTGTDTFSVSIDGDNVFSATDLDAETYSTYSQVTVDVSAFGDCESHNLKFSSTTLGSAVTNFFVDDVVLEVLEPASCDLPTATPTNTATSTDTPTPTETHTPTPEPSATPTATHTSTPEPSFTPTDTHTPTPEPSFTPTDTHTPTPEPSATPTETSTPIPAPTETHTSTTEPGPTTTETNTPTPESLATPTETHTPTVEPSATPTETPIPSPTITQAAPTATSTPAPGDLNMDRNVNVLDVQLCVNVFLDTETDPGIIGRSDVNGDESVDVLDVQLIVNIFLEG